MPTVSLASVGRMHKLLADLTLESMQLDDAATFVGEEHGRTSEKYVRACDRLDQKEAELASSLRLVECLLGKGAADAMEDRALDEAVLRYNRRR